MAVVYRARSGASVECDHRVALTHAVLCCIAAFTLSGCGPGSSATPVATQAPPATPRESRNQVATPAGRPAPTALPTEAATETPRAGIGAWLFSSERAKRDVDVLAGEIGPRVAGSPAQGQAADYLAAQLAAAGLPVEKQEFRFSAYQDRGSRLRGVSPEELSLQSQTIQNSPAGDVEAELVFVDLALPGTFDPGSVRGKIALARRGEIKFSEKAANLSAAGAIGVAIFNNQPGGFVGAFEANATLPAVSLSREDGEQLVEILGRGPATVQLRVDADHQERTAVNVIGTRAGGPGSVVIGGHYDSVSAGPGANDNASGTATVLELARATATRHYPFSIRFIAFGAEEFGLLGSRHYVSQLDAPSRQAMLAMINLDMVAVGQRLVLSGDAALVERAVQRAAQSGLIADRLPPRGDTASDHASFQAVGVPVMFVNRPDDPHFHRPEDRPEFVEPDHLRAVGQLVLDLLDELAEDSRSS